MADTASAGDRASPQNPITGVQKVMADESKSDPQNPQEKILAEWAAFANSLREKASAAVALGTFCAGLDRIREFVSKCPSTVWTARSTLNARWGELEANLRLGHAGAVELIMGQILATVRTAAVPFDPYISRKIPLQNHNLPGR